MENEAIHLTKMFRLVFLSVPHQFIYLCIKDIYHRSTKSTNPRRVNKKETKTNLTTTTKIPTPQFVS